MRSILIARTVPVGMKICSLIFLNAFLLQGINSQELVFERITTEQGLSNNMIRCVVQDNMGFLWFGTNDGLNRYDGYNFEILSYVFGDSLSISNNTINTLLTDKKGNLWIGTKAGLDKLKLRTEEITHIRFPNDQSQVQNNNILSLCEDKDGNLWVGTNAGALKIDAQSDEISKVDSVTGPVYSIFQDTNNHLWFGGAYGNLFFLPSGGGKVSIFKLQSENPARSQSEIWMIREDRMGRILVGNTTGLYHFDLHNNTFQSYISELSNIGSYRNNEIRCFFEEVTGSYWIGSWGKGLYKYDLKDQSIENFRLSPNNPFSLSNNDVNFIYKDYSGVTWIGTEDGLNKLDPALRIFNHIQSIPNNSNSLSLNYVTCFEEEEDQTIWIGTFGGGLNKFDRHTGSFRHITSIASNHNSLCNNAIRALVLDHENNLWIGTMQGLDLYDTETEQFIHYNRSDNSPLPICGEDIMSLHEDHFGNLWIGTYGNGITRIDRSRRYSTHFRPENADIHGLTSAYIRTIYEDTKGNIWVGCVESGGLFRFLPEKQSFEHYLSNVTDSSSISSDYINCIYDDQKGNLWIGTWNGINLYNYENDSFTRVWGNSVDGGVKITEILSDELGNLWISTQMGLSKIELNSDKKPERIVNYTLKNGIQGNEFNVNSKLKSKSGDLFFGGTNGFNFFTPVSVIENKYNAPIVITDFQIFNHSIKPGKTYDGRMIIHESITTNPDLHLKFKDKVISFEFTALSYSLPGHNKFEYRMEGIDREWVKATSDRRFVTYTNLDNGDYTFYVRGSNNDDHWNMEGASINIHVDPPYYRTSLAFIIYFIFIILSIIGIRRILMIRLQLKNELYLERINMEKAEEINQMKLRFFTNISHEFKTPLTLILGPLEDILTKKINREELQGLAVIMHKNANRLLRLVNQLMDFRRIEKENLELNLERKDIIQFFREVTMSFKKHAGQKGIEYVFESVPEKLEGWIDTDVLEKVMFNLLSNAFKFTKSGESISVRLTTGSPLVLEDESTKEGTTNLLDKRNFNIGENDFLIVSVKDTGIGISEENLKAIFERFNKIYKSNNNKSDHYAEGSGIGLNLTKKLIILNKGEISVQSKEGAGSTFTFKIPIRREYFDEDDFNHQPLNLNNIHYKPSDYLMHTEIPEDHVMDPIKESKELEKSGIQVLVVEDNPDLRTYLRYSLEPVYTVLEAENGKQALKIASERMPDLIVSDIMMPEMDGITLCKELKNQFTTSHIPVIMLTAKENVESKIEGYQSGADDYIPKPFNPKLLAVRIQNLLENRNKLQESYKRKLAMEPSDTEEKSKDDLFLEKAVKIIEENLSNSEFSVDDFGDALFLSRMQLYRKLKSLTSLSANEFIRTVRLRKAAQLLKTGNYTISEVSYEVGFTDPKYFSKCFHKLYNMTPSSFMGEQ